MKEIERKFLVRSREYRKEARLSYRIVQGFLNTDPERTVRVRIKGDKGFITVKGRSDARGLERFEWEKEISPGEAGLLLPLCEKGVIDKIRYEVVSGPHVIEVDEFSGDNDGLILAEIELGDADEVYRAPSWLGQEVTGDTRYYNSQLSRCPYKDWGRDSY
ncbi:CYTH domain-containing protein [Sinomicrobium soli]|uniref:CYTH domain-containing protein n=1 Tax=Sinomicrobium sp. N-1-3-6 TaxID=2219864 RepID=UPI000DCD0551|nr:CYTH domain-containing protein [Sinomicrobium sp. N-1-3-6]RAV28259.1 adenylate cyclase [Sinomicrobium sp. N-1-3-6]